MKNAKRRPEQSRNAAANTIHKEPVDDIVIKRARCLLSKHCRLPNIVDDALVNHAIIKLRKESRNGQEDLLNDDFDIEPIKEVQVVDELVNPLGPDRLERISRGFFRNEDKPAAKNAEACDDDRRNHCRHVTRVTKLVELLQRFFEVLELGSMN